MNWKRFAMIFLVLLVCGMGGPVTAATYSDFVTGDLKLSKSALEPTSNWMPFVDYRKFDLSDQNINGGSGVTTGDVVRLFNVSSNTYIEEFGFRCTTAAVKSGTSAAIGDGATAAGFVATTYSPYASAATARYNSSYVNFDAASSSGVSVWRFIGPLHAAGPGSFSVMLSGVSMNQSNSGASPWVVNANHGTYFTGQSGISPYINADTIDATFYVDKSFNPGTGKAGVTPVFEAYIKGFKRVVP
jgi:hypothetical protein